MTTDFKKCAVFFDKMDRGEIQPLIRIIEDLSYDKTSLICFCDFETREELHFNFNPDGSFKEIFNFEGKKKEGI